MITYINPIRGYGINPNPTIDYSMPLNVYPPPILTI